MKTTTAQLRKMDELMLVHVAKVAQRCLDESKAAGRKDLVTYWQGKVDQIGAETKRRIAAEVA